MMFPFIEGKAQQDWQKWGENKDCAVDSLRLRSLVGMKVEVSTGQLYIRIWNWGHRQDWRFFKAGKFRVCIRINKMGFNFLKLSRV